MLPTRTCLRAANERPEDTVGGSGGPGRTWARQWPRSRVAGTLRARSHGGRRRPRRRRRPQRSTHVRSGSQLNKARSSTSQSLREQSTTGCEQVGVGSLSAACAACNRCGLGKRGTTSARMSFAHAIARRVWMKALSPSDSSSDSSPLNQLACSSCTTSGGSLAAANRADRSSSRLLAARAPSEGEESARPAKQRGGKGGDIHGARPIARGDGEAWHAQEGARRPTAVSVCGSRSDERVGDDSAGPSGAHLRERRAQARQSRWSAFCRGWGHARAVAPCPGAAGTRPRLLAGPLSDRSCRQSRPPESPASRPLRNPHLRLPLSAAAEARRQAPPRVPATSTGDLAACTHLRSAGRRTAVRVPSDATRCGVLSAPDELPRAAKGAPAYSTASGRRSWLRFVQQFPASGRRTRSHLPSPKGRPRSIRTPSRRGPSIVCLPRLGRAQTCSPTTKLAQHTERGKRPPSLKNN